VSIFSEVIDNTVHLNAIYARKGLLLSEHSNATMCSYRDIANLLTKEEEEEEER
jgi:hypothetical protein